MSAGRIVTPSELAEGARTLMDLGLPPEAAFHVASVHADVLEYLEEEELLKRTEDGKAEVTAWGKIVLEALERFAAPPG